MKPANILLTFSGDLKLADLGLARSLGESAAGARSASKGAAGTFAYMPPEALATQPLRTLAVDIWSVGVVALQLASLEANLGDSPIGLGDLATVKRQTEDRLSSLQVGLPYLEAVRLMLTCAHDERATASELLCETAFYDAATELATAKPALVELHSLEEDAEKLAAKKQAAAETLATKLKAAAEAEELAVKEAEYARVHAGGCAAGLEHNWLVHKGTHGFGRACRKCLEVQDNATGEAIWWCASVAERNRILDGGCPAEDPNQGSHAWEYRNGQKGSGRMCTRCGKTEDSSGKMILLPQLVGAFGPATGNPHAGRR